VSDTATLPASLPEVADAQPPKLPPVAERTLRNGLRVMAVRRTGVPRVEARLRIPIARGKAVGDGAAERVLAGTLLSGTATRSATDIAEHLQLMGSGLFASAGSEELSLAGSVLSGNLAPFLELMAEAIAEPAFPKDEVELQKARVAQEVVIGGSQPALQAQKALVERIYGSHPYARVLPAVESVEALKRASLVKAKDGRLLPNGSALVLVGELRPERALDLAERAFGGWKGVRGGKVGLPAPAPFSTGPIVLVDRPGAVQTNIRVGGNALSRTAAGYPALALANMVFGGYFSSRLVENIRERRGYTYSPHSGIEHRHEASNFNVGADVATEVTAAALVEIRYELGRMAAAPVDADELDGARRYLIGNMALAHQTQAGLASYIALLTAGGLGIEYLRDFPEALLDVTIDDVLAAGAAFLAPRRLVTALVGDASRVRESLELLDDVEVHSL
jgi:predicted Zn-dependent peptidase